MMKGMAIAAYLLYKNYFSNATDALEFFAQRRSKSHEGVSTPSQKRLVHVALPHSLLHVSLNFECIQLRNLKAEFCRSKIYEAQFHRNYASQN